MHTARLVCALIAPVRQLHRAHFREVRALKTLLVVRTLFSCARVPGCATRCFFRAVSALLACVLVAATARLSSRPRLQPFLLLPARLRRLCFFLWLPSRFCRRPRTGAPWRRRASVLCRRPRTGIPWRRRASSCRRLLPCAGCAFSLWLPPAGLAGGRVRVFPGGVVRLCAGGRCVGLSALF